MRMRWPHRPPGLRWPLHRPRFHHGRVAWVDLAWAVFSVANLAAIVIFSRWETVPFHFIWISLTLLYGFRVWSTRPTAWVLAVVMITTGAAIGWDVYTGAQTVDELNEVPLMAAMFWMMVWHAQRRLAADNERELVSAENARLLHRSAAVPPGCLAPAPHADHDRARARRAARQATWPGTRRHGTSRWSWASSPGCAASGNGC